MDTIPTLAATVTTHQEAYRSVKAAELNRRVIATPYNTTSTSQVEIIKWKPPEAEWIKLNVDGVSKGNPGLAGGGGLFRDHMGTFLRGYAFTCGNCRALTSEIWAVFYGLQMGIRMGLTRLIIETDSTSVCNLIGNGVTGCHPDFHLIKRCRRLVESNNWQVNFCHIRRRGNAAAYSLANWSLNLVNSFVEIVKLPTCVKVFVDADNDV